MKLNLPQSWYLKRGKQEEMYFAKLGPQPVSKEEEQRNSSEIDKLIKEIQMSAELSNPNPVLRLKMNVGTVKHSSNSDGEKYQEEITFSAVYSSQEGSANQQWSKWTPSANLSMSISNPAAFGKLLPGQFVFVDIIPCDKDSL